MPEVETMRKLLISSQFYSGMLRGRDAEVSRPEFSSCQTLGFCGPVQFHKTWVRHRVFKFLFGQGSSILILKRAHEQQPKNTYHLLSFYEEKENLIPRKQDNLRLKSRSLDCIHVALLKSSSHSLFLPFLIFRGLVKLVC